MSLFWYADNISMESLRGETTLEVVNDTKEGKVWMFTRSRVICWVV